MKLKKIIKNIPNLQVRGSKEIEISGICSDSRYVSYGNLFIAKKGNTFDATDFIMEAAEAGAVAVVTDIFNPFIKNIVQVITEDVSKVEADLAKNYYQFPTKDLLKIAITGTNGKTTTSYFIKKILDHIKPCGLIGTIEYFTGKNFITAQRTTPDSITVHKLLKEMHTNACKAALMELTSHGIDQNRCKNIDFDIAIFTNLSSDHLDYHKTFENYLLTKKNLFLSLKNTSLAIINIDDPFAKQMLNGTKAKILTYGFSSIADVKAFNLNLSLSESKFSVSYKEQGEDFTLKLLGKHNVYNALAAISAGLSLDIPLKTIKAKIATLSNILGRLERINIDNNFSVFVDFAHTEDALKNSLKTLKQFTKGRLICVFGCGGNRDQGKRDKMAIVSETYADYTIVTSDNPRNEDPVKICQDIIKGFSKKKDYLVEIDRKIAIEKALFMAKKDDIVLIAGKGHEKMQTFQSKSVPFDDKKIVELTCKNI